MYLGVTDIVGRVRLTSPTTGPTAAPQEHDFACAYEVAIAPDDNRSSEQWARAVWERGASSAPVVHARRLAPCSRAPAGSATFTRPHTRMADRRPRPRRNRLSAPLRVPHCAQRVPQGRWNVRMVNLRHLQAADGSGHLAPGVTASPPPRPNRAPTSSQPIGLDSGVPFPGSHPTGKCRICSRASQNQGPADLVPVIVPASPAPQRMRRRDG
jgi:hypothetical protein